MGGEATVWGEIRSAGNRGWRWTGVNACGRVYRLFANPLWSGVFIARKSVSLTVTRSVHVCCVYRRQSLTVSRLILLQYPRRRESVSFNVVC